MGQGDYSLTEFAHRLAQSEAKYGKELLEIIECFTNSRVDLPVKKLEDLSRARMKCARHLLKIDFRKEECINLWKLCNVYSTTAVDVDNAMRDIRSALRKRLKTKDTTYRDVSTFRRLIDEYRPMKKAVDLQEIYDKPITKEKQRWLELNMFGKKKEEKKSIVNYDRTSRKSTATSKPDIYGKDDTLYITETPMDSQLKPTFISFGTDHEAHTDLPVISPVKLRSFLPSTRPPHYPPPPSTISTASTKTSSIRNNSRSNVTWSPAKPIGGKLGRSCSSKQRNVTESEIYDAQSLLSLSDNFEVANERASGPLPSPQPRPFSVQVFSGNSMQPVAPPRLNALKAKTTTVVPNQNNGIQCVSNVGETNESKTNADITYSHTLIKIFPSNDGDTADMTDDESERTHSRRPGILGKQHLIEIDPNPIKQDASIQKIHDADPLATCDGEFAIIVNRL